MTELAQHHFELINDEFRVTIDATCNDWLWRNLVSDLANRLAKPAVITFPEKLTAAEAKSLRECLTSRWPA